MPRPTKKAKTKAAKVKPEVQVDGNLAEAAPVATAVAEAPVEEAPPPPILVEPPEKEKAKAKPPIEDDKDRIAATAINIAKLQAMSMPELNQMARELSVENFGTMRKHRVIFHILPKNAARGCAFLGRGAGNPGRGLRLPALPKLQLSAVPGGHLRLALPDSAIRLADRQPDRWPNPAAQGEGTVLRAAQSRGGGSGRAGQGQGQDSFRQPDATVPEQALYPGDHARRVVHAGARPGLPNWQRVARADRAAAAHWQDRPDAEARQCDAEE